MCHRISISEILLAWRRKVNMQCGKFCTALGKFCTLHLKGKKLYQLFPSSYAYNFTLETALLRSAVSATL
jgi:hypothetical protein